MTAPFSVCIWAASAEMKHKQPSSLVKFQRQTDSGAATVTKSQLGKIAPSVKCQNSD